MALMAPPRGVHPGDYLVVVHDFDARGADELTLRRGDKIELVELDDGFGDGWYLGKHVKTGTTGLFPGVYTAATPKIAVRQQSGAPESVESDSQHGDELNVVHTTTDVDARVMSPISEDITPQASRHVSSSDMQAPPTGPEDAAPSPKMQQRSSSSPLPTTTLASDIRQTIRQSIESHLNGEDSPVMNETLSVIDEHITDLSTPRHSIATLEPKAVTDSGSEYSSHISHRLSYINGHETDEEEESQPTEEEVRSWNHTETGKRLRDLGIEARHCEIFEEQEITGDVLLDMDQDFLFMKEFDFGVMGRRLKTWHKIKAFQEEIKGLKPQTRGSTSGFAGLGGPIEERTLSRAGHTGPLLPRIPSLSEKSLAGYHQSRMSTASGQHPRLVSSNMHSNTSSPLSPQTPSYGMDLPRTRRPSAASIREINHSRRHSSIDATGRSPGLSETSPGSHRKKSSFDRAWTMSTGAQGLVSRPGTSLGTTTEGLLPQHIFRGADINESDSAISVTDKFDELDRGYFSGTEVDSRRNRRVLQKRDSISGSANHSRKSSYAEEQARLAFANKRHSRIGSADSIRDVANHTSPAAKAYHGALPKGRFRSFSTRIAPSQKSQSSNVTSLEDKSAPGSGFFASIAPLVGKTDTESSGRSSPTALQQIKNAGPKFRRAVGLRAISDVVSKGIDTSATPASPVKDHDPSSARTGSTTPSATSWKSSERHSTDGSGKTAEGSASLPRPRTSVKGGTKSKKDTSAYMRGLEKKTPQEQMKGSDYCGWMKKRSSNLMTTWKPRLFVLRGRRLSYYYSENDTEERGLIDITAHRVLRADRDPIVALHATITGATASPTSPPNSNNAELFPSDQASASSDSNHAAKSDSDGPFFFKLVPPKSGVSRTVQFTKPAIHYFQVDNVKEGRLWMAALMKATIERDMTLPVESTNKQKTISLKQARLNNQRPPALMSMPSTEAAEVAKDQPSTEKDNGLMIKGLNFDKPSGSSDDKNEPMSSNPLGGLDTGPTSLLPESLTESLTESSQGN